MGGGVGRSGFEFDHRFTWFAVTELFPGESLDGFRITAQRLDGASHLFAELFSFLDFSIESQDLFAHPLILTNQGKVPNRHREQPGNEQKELNHAGQLIPNVQFDVHCESKSCAGV